MANKYAVAFDVNTKAAAGMVHAGMTFKEVERFACKIVPPAETILKRREREIGPAIEEVLKIAKLVLGEILTRMS